MGRNTGGNPGDVRKSALWGSGNRGGEHRSNALWGKGGRGFVTTVLVVALAVPLAAGAGSGPGKNEGVVTPGGTYVSAELKQMQRTHPNEMVDVIVQTDDDRVGQGCEEGRARAQEARAALRDHQGLRGSDPREGPGEAGADQGPHRHRGCGDSAAGAAPDPVIRRRADVDPAVDVRDRCRTSSGASAKSATIAIVDSGIDASRADFKGRVKAQVSFVTSAYPNAAGDGRGHGTFVAGIAAGSAPGYAGAAPNADIVSLDVMDDRGAGKTSDVIAAAEWIYRNKAAYNIRVANFSLHSGAVNHFWLDPLNVAVEQAVALRRRRRRGCGQLRHARTGRAASATLPASDPFVVTVGAVDIGGTSRPRDDARAPWSAYGRTPDGFLEAGDLRTGPVHGRSDPDGLDAGGAEGGQAGRGRLHPSSPGPRSRRR